MAFSRVAALRSAIRAVRPSIARPQSFRQVTRRSYASGHGSSQAGGDLWWGLGAVGVTIPTCWYILSNSPEPAHGHHGDGHGKDHKEEHEETSEEASEEESKDEPEEESKDESEDKEASSDADDKDSENSEDSESGDDEKKEADTPETSDDEGAKDSEEKKDGNTKKSIPDAKGGSKKRLESNNAIKAGENDNADAAPSKQAGSQNTQSGKQEGLTNTDTKHSTDISNDPSMSKKAEGGPDTAKVKGTIDPNRPQV